MSNKNKQSAFRIFAFAAIICLICSLVVSFTAVNLRDKQLINAENEKKINILVAAGLVDSGTKPSSETIQRLYKKVLPIVVNLKTGTLDLTKDAETYDMYAAAEVPAESSKLVNDPAGIGRIADDGEVYVLLDNGTLKRIVLPIQGYGLWSTLYGFTSIVFEDGQPVIKGITFYDQGETPGLGARITEPSWQAKWDGVLPYDKQGNPDVVLSKRKNVNHANEVDALSGATLTSNGVQHLMNFWLGKQGYQSFLNNVQAGDITVEQMQEASKAKAGGQE